MPQVLSLLGTDDNAGLGTTQVHTLLQRHGGNELPQAPTVPLWRVFLRQFRSPLIYILFVAAGIALGLGHGSDALAILAVVVGNALIGALQEGRAERSMAALRQLSALRVRVRRDGAEHTLLARELVPGDLLVLAAGDAIPADARVLEAAQLQVAEAALTGESVPVGKTARVLPEATSLPDRHNMLYSGTHVTAGHARAVVVATGSTTEVGRIAGLTAHAPEPRTPLELRIEQFGRWLVGAALGLFALVLLLGLWRQLPLADVLMVAISQMVSMVPEGLPVAMTVALAVGMQRMAGQGAVIRRLAAVETLGSTTVICTDKTGTLTRNEMTVVQLWLPKAECVAVTGSGYAADGSLHPLDQPQATLEPAQHQAVVELAQAVTCNNDADWSAPAQPGQAPGIVGDPTEVALLVLALKAGLNLRATRDAAPREAELPFDSETKLMATRHRLPDAPQRVYVKGAPEAVLRLLPAAQAQLAAAAKAAAEALSGQALRVLAVGSVDAHPLDAEAGFEALAGQVRLLGLVAQIDPPREEVRDTVAQCRAAGIRTVMITGDHQATGLAIAHTLGIAGPADLAVAGDVLEHMDPAELDAKLDHIAVFARVQPAQKLRIVEALQARGAVVAMTGDGVNDAPALARADVGVAMGITGTEVAKSAARIVLTDDNFGTLVRAIEQGRVVYANLKKVILYLFATSIDEVTILLLALLAGYPLPLAAVQILWINIVTEGTLTVNLVMDPASGREMARPPVPRNDALIDRSMLARVLLMASAAVVATLGWFVWRLDQGVALELVRTETFTVLTMCQWFNIINCQSATRSAISLAVLRNRWLLGGLLLSVLLQAAVLYAPPLNTLFQTVPPEPSTLLALAAVASLVLWAEELRKLWARGRLGGQAGQAGQTGQVGR